jgi:lethal(2) giant larvae protein
LVFLLTIPGKEGDKRKEDKVTAMLGKEIQLKHKAPVICIHVLTSANLPLSTEDEAKEAPHKVLIASEEQFKMFLLPTLKPCGKYKLTAHEGARIRKIGFTTFVSKSDNTYSENCFTCLTNQGDLAIHSLPELRRQVLQKQCMRKEDVIAISTLVFTPTADAFYLSSSSELARVSMATAQFLEPNGKLSIAPYARHEIIDDSAKKEDVMTKKIEAVPDKKVSSVEAEVAVTRQNQLNEQQAQGKINIFFTSLIMLKIFLYSNSQRHFLISRCKVPSYQW